MDMSESLSTRCERFFYNPRTATIFCYGYVRVIIVYTIDHCRSAVTYRLGIIDRISLTSTPSTKTRGDAINDTCTNVLNHVWFFGRTCYSRSSNRMLTNVDNYVIGAMHNRKKQQYKQDVLGLKNIEKDTYTDIYIQYMGSRMPTSKPSIELKYNFTAGCKLAEKLGYQNYTQLLVILWAFIVFF
ncbi:hypothetical protein BDC45DRAFT_558588 [Circinella umbellata]|nr:hypothetical protein BDC45DRAFT_558588 [Circinella umbellata]